MTARQSDPPPGSVVGKRYRWNHSTSVGDTTTVGELRIPCTRAVLIDIGEIDLKVIARDSIHSVTEDPA